MACLLLDTFLFGKDQVICLINFAVHSFMFVDWARLKLLRHHFAFVHRLVGFDIVTLHFGQVELLRSQNRPWSHNPYPANEGLRRNLVMLHGPEADEGAGPPKASFAVD